MVSGQIAPPPGVQDAAQRPTSLWARLPITPCLMALFVVLALGYMLLIPRWLPYDEAGHFYYVAHIVGLPGFPFPNPAIYHLDYQLHRQPPLAYIVYSPFLKIVASGRLATHILVLRLVTIGIGALTIWVNMSVIGLLAGKSAHRRLLLALAGVVMVCNPAFLAVHASITNDALSFLLLGLATRIALHLAQPTLPRHAWLWLLGLGLVLGLAGATKTLALPLLVLPIGVVAVRYLLCQRDTALLRWLVPALVISVLCAAPFFISNQINTGDPFGTQYWRTINPTTRSMQPGDLPAFLVFGFATYWQFTNFLRNLLPVKPGLLDYLPVLAISCAPLVLLVRRAAHRRLRGLGSPAWAVATCAICLGLVAYVIKNLTDFGPEGRYLFSAIGPLALLIAGGVIGCVPDRPKTRQVIVGCVALFLIAYAIFAALHYLTDAPAPSPWLYTDDDVVPHIPYLQSE